MSRLDIVGIADPPHMWAVEGPTNPVDLPDEFVQLGYLAEDD